jgi:hypothetical protein
VLDHAGVLEVHGDGAREDARGAVHVHLTTRGAEENRGRTMKGNLASMSCGGVGRGEAVNTSTGEVVWCGSV